MKRNRNDERWCCLILGCVPTLNQESWTHYCEGLRALKILHQEERHPVGGRGSDLNLVCFLKLKYPQTSAFLGSECCSSTADPGWNVPRGLILTFPLMQRWMGGWMAMTLCTDIHVPLRMNCSNFLSGTPHQVEIVLRYTLCLILRIKQC